MHDMTVFTGRCYNIATISFEQEIEELYKKAKNHRSRFGSSFTHQVYLKWGDLIVIFDFKSSPSCLTLVAETWFFNAYFNSSYSSGVNADVYSITGNISDFEKWELMVKLGSKPPQKKDDDDIPF